MARGERKVKFEEPTVQVVVALTKRWEVTVHYLDEIGQRKVTQRYFDQRADAELSVKQYLLSGATILGGDVIHIVPPHMIQGLTLYDRWEGADADPAQ